VEGNADYIVTGDTDLLVLKELKGIKILRPHDFLEELEAE
jgi:predicted nucleic acid-binding protein